jgi:hypothetical protein
VKHSSLAKIILIIDDIEYKVRKVVPFSSSVRYFGVTVNVNVKQYASLAPSSQNMFITT